MLSGWGGAQVAKQLSSGTGDIDEAELLGALPEKLQLSKAKVTSTIQGLAKDRKRTTLVQVTAPATPPPPCCRLQMCLQALVEILLPTSCKVVARLHWASQL